MSKDDDKSSTRVVGRIRPFMPWEESKPVYELKNGNEIGLPSHKSGGQNTRFQGDQEVINMDYMKMDDVFDLDKGTLETFNGSGKQLCDNLIETGFNSLLFAYGQTGSGKTFTLLGNPGKDDGEKGLLTMCIDYLLASDKTKSANMSVIEVYGVSAKSQSIFDLFDTQNITGEGGEDWDKKKDEKSIPKPIKKQLTAKTDVGALILAIQSAAHYAPTGKNPQSSRGHTAFIVQVTMTDGHVANLICLDLAGSEGLTAVTPEFIKKVGKKAGQTRLMEGGAINYGLQQMQGLLREIGTKKGVEKTQGTGLRKLLWPYLQKKNQPMIMGMFMLSPSVTNLKTSRDTLRIASILSGLKITPQKVKKKKSKADIIRALKKTIRDQHFKIDKLQNENMNLKEGTAAANRKANYMGMTLDSELEDRISDCLKQEHIEYNLEDLQHQKRDLEAEKAVMVAAAEKDDDADIKQDIEDIQKEIDEIQRRMKSEAAVEKEMADVIRRSTISSTTVMAVRDEAGVQELRVKFNDLRKTAKDREQDLVDFVEDMRHEQMRWLSKISFASS